MMSGKEVVMGGYSGLLYAEPSFMEGVARVLDPLGFLNGYNTSPSGHQADYLALASDWKAVGEEIARATQAIRAIDTHQPGSASVKVK